MSSPEILVVLPTLGDRLESLAETLRAIDRQRDDVDLTLVVVAPATATAARTLSRRHGAVLVDDPGTGISEAINCGLRARNSETFYAWMGDDDLFRAGGLLALRSILMSQCGQRQNYLGITQGDCPIKTEYGSS